MKKSFIIMLFSVLLLNLGFVEAQTAVLTQTSCNSVKVALTGACGNGYYGQGYYRNGAWYLNAYKNYTYKVTLAKLAGSGPFPPEVTYYLEGGNNTSWTNLEVGSTYKVIVQRFICGTAPANDAVGRRLGFFGAFGDVFSSNEITVGPTRVEDNVYNFYRDGFSIGNNPSGLPVFNPSDYVKLNGTASKNYDAFWLAIFETNPDGTQGRSTSLGGWQFEQIGIRNLTEIWANGTGWTFLPYYKYRVQIALSKNSCGSWTESIKEFRMCPDGWSGCRIGGELLEKITISPNPASDKFQLNGIDFSTGKVYKVSISDISGKEIETFSNVKNNEFNTNNFANGVYIVNLLVDNRRLFSSKLIVNK